MKRVGLSFTFLFLVSSYALSAPLATAALNVIPKEVQQIISVDYRSLKASPTALALKDRVLPANIKDFETALRGVGIDPEKEVETLVFVSFRSDGSLHMVGVAQGSFSSKAVLLRLRRKKIRPSKYGDSLLYPVSGMNMNFLDDSTMLFGDSVSIRAALDAQNGQVETVTANTQVMDLISGADSGPVWSVLDAAGTQYMMRSALGDAAGLADYESVKKRLLGSRYSMDFNGGVNFDLDVVTSDTFTAAALSSLMKAGVMFRRMSASGAEKVALENVAVNSDKDRLQVRFKTDDKKFQSLLQSDLFASIAR